MLKLLTGLLVFSLTTSAFAGMFGNRHRSNHYQGGLVSTAQKAVPVAKPAVVVAKPAENLDKKSGGIFHKRRHHFGGFRVQASK